MSEAWKIDERGAKADVLAALASAGDYLPGDERRCEVQARDQLIALVDAAPDGTRVLAVAEGAAIVRYFHFQVTP